MSAYQRLVLRMLTTYGPLSRQELQRLTRLRPGNLGRVLRDLQCLGWIEKSGRYRTNLWSRTSEQVDTRG